MSGKLTAFLVLAFAAVCASTSPGPDICADTSKECNEKKCKKDWKNAIKRKKTCGLCGPSQSPEPGSGPDICADTSKKCKPKKCKIYKCKKTCGLCVEPIQSPEPSPGPDTCAGLKDNEKKCKKMIKKKQCKKNPTKCKEKYKEKCSKHKKTKKWCKETCCHILAFPSSPP